MKITKKQITKAIEDAIIKCKPTLAEMHHLLNNMSQDEKDFYFHYATKDDEEMMKGYEEALNNGDDEEIFKYERNIFDNLNKTQRKNLTKYLSDFNAENYQYDEDVGYPNHDKGALEKSQEKLQEENGYSKEVLKAFSMWTGGFYDEIQRYVHYGTIPSSAFYDGYEIKMAGDVIRDFIQNTVGLQEDTLLFRGGHWDIGMRVGDVGTIPCLNSLSYSRDSAYAIGVDSYEDEDGNIPPNKYMINVYCDKGTKGAMVNASHLVSEFPEHEYLIDKGMRYIVLDVDDVNKTASIKLIPNE